MRFGLSKPLTDLLLNSVKPGYSRIFAKALSSFTKSDLVDFIAIKKMSRDDIGIIASGLRSNLTNYPNGRNLDLANPQVLQVGTEDIELSDRDRFGEIVIASRDDLEVRYGSKGKSASLEITPEKLLTHSLSIPGGSFGVLMVAKHVPFKIASLRSVDSLAIANCELVKVLSVEENIKRYSLEVITDLPYDLAKRTAIKIQGRIFEDRRNENFYEEVTSKVFMPTDYIRSSGTLMNFERKQFGVDNTTDSHYHPGERSLIIFTTDKEAGVTLNFCGVNESPEQRKDCEVKRNFPQNSFLVLTFPPYTHHKFHGEFVCMSIHPREGQNIINAVKSGTLPRGFLESATVFSKKESGATGWDLSIPASSGRQYKVNSR